MQSSAKTVTEYLRELEPEKSSGAKRIRQLIKKAAPAAGESMKWGMPTYSIGEPLCSFAAQKNYLALYVMDTRLVDRYREELSDLDVGKGCIRIRNIDDAPFETLEKIVREAASRRAAGKTERPCD